MRHHNRERSELSQQRVWVVLTDFLSPIHGLVVASFVVIMILSSVGLRYLNTSVRIETLFGHDSRLLSDYRWLEENVAPVVPVEIVLTFDKEHAASYSYQLSWVQYLHSQIAAHDGFGGVVSAATFSTGPSQLAGNDQSQPTVSGTRPPTAEQMASLFRQYRFLVQTGDGDYQWRLRGFMSANTDTDVWQVLPDVEQDLTAKLVNQHGALIEGVTIETTGVMPLVHDIQHQLMNDLQYSFLFAFAIILVVMTVMQGSIRAGVIAMVPNIFPTLLLFGILGSSGIAIDIGSVMTASVALGVAVDDTLHFSDCLSTQPASGPFTTGRGT